MHMPARTLKVRTNIDEEGHWEALSKQNIDFVDALAELIDNSISASIKDQAYFLKTTSNECFRVQVTIERQDADHVHFIVADSGHGMTADDLAEHVMRSGDRIKADGILNEHGYGMKNALCVLTKNRGSPPFLVLTRTKDEPLSGYHAKFEGPFKGDKDGKVVEDKFPDLWSEGTTTLDQHNSGTRVHFTTTYEQFNSIYPPARNMDTIMKALRERLGVVYRHFLEKTGSNQIWIAWKDADMAGLKLEEIKPIFPIFRAGQDAKGKKWLREDEIEVKDENGTRHKVLYRRGVVDWKETREHFEKPEFSNLAKIGGDSPFRIHYKNNQRAQGVDIVYRGRTLNTSLMHEIWDNVGGGAEGKSIPPHNRFNSFVGEIIIRGGKFETVNNKTGIHEESEVWKRLKNALNVNELFHPIPFGEKEEEADLKARIANQMEKETATEKVMREQTYSGVRVDILQIFEKDYEFIYEVKRGLAHPLDVYQLVMYWDACKQDNRTKLEKGILIASRMSSDAERFLEQLNKRKDAEGEPYKLEFKPLSDYNL